MTSFKRARRAAAATALFGAFALLMTCTASANAFDTYTNAYRSVTANGGFDADLDAVFTMDGTEAEATGNFKVDNSGENTLLYLEVEVNDETVTQFSDGEYLYVDARGEKSKYPLGEKQGQEQSRKEPEMEGKEEQSAPTFDTTQFLEEFASCLEAGKIQEMGLLSPLDKSIVSDTSVDGNTYSLTVSPLVLVRMESVLASSINMEDDSVEVKDLKNFTYDAVIEDNLVTSITYGGTMTVNVGEAVSGTGSDESYDLDITITATFNNPGEAVSTELPDTSGY